MTKIILDKPGAKSVGDYQAGVEYEVDKAEADRLIKIKGFKLVKPTENKLGD